MQLLSLASLLRSTWAHVGNCERTSEATLHSQHCLIDTHLYCDSGPLCMFAPRNRFRHRGGTDASDASYAICIDRLLATCCKRAPLKQKQCYKLNPHEQLHDGTRCCLESMDHSNIYLTAAAYSRPLIGLRNTPWLHTTNTCCARPIVRTRYTESTKRAPSQDKPEDATNTRQRQECDIVSFH